MPGLINSWSSKRNELTYILIFAMGLISNAQVCTYNDLSKSLTLKTEIKRIKQKEAFDSCIVTITIQNKLSSKIVQVIRDSSTYLFSDAFSNCDFVRSYSTGINKNIEAGDNDYGDVIIADFNFDGKEDLAYKRDSGGNGGPNYCFYIQNKEGRFILDKFLSDSMVYFPIEINKSKKNLMTLVHANAKEMSERIFHFNSATGRWKMISHRWIDY